ncbi:MAG: DNA gyrase subunit A [Ruminococcaceae bacterium]|nr:DNA gyrase subunit A [Oscillospiraceae bacterium]
MTFENQTIIPVEIRNEMKNSYMDYAMSVIVGRALPDVRDGLKPVHRRILYTMHEAGLTSDKPFKKSAATVGDVLGKYHPHGDAAVYDTMVRMAQPFSLRYILVDGHGNFGSVDGDPPAAYRYTEARMAKISQEMLRDIDSDTVDFDPNYDYSRKEPRVLPSRFPNLMVNGSVGIAVGMATNIPPHNLSETIDAVCALIDDPEITVDGLMEHIKGPDFPTGAYIMGTAGIRAAYHTGRGRITMRAKAEIEEYKDHQRIVVSEIPYMVNKARLVAQIAELVKDKRIEGISAIRDESGRNGMHIVFDLKRDANAQVVLNLLYKHSQLQETFSAIMLTLVDNQPKTLSLKQMLEEYLKFQRQVITRRTQFELAKAEREAHILEGLKIAIENIDEVVEIIKKSTSIPNAKANLIERFGLTDVQADAIVNMTLGRLTGLETEKIMERLAALYTKIADLKAILASGYRIDAIIKEELLEIKRKYGDARRTEIMPVEDELDIEDLIPEESCALTLTHYGYIKRMPVSAYKSQHRGGRGISAMTTREEDFVEELFIASTHDYVLFFTSKGRFYRKKCYEIPESSRTAKGVNIVNLLQLGEGEKVTTMIRVPEFGEGYLLFVTKNGLIKRTELNEYRTMRVGGVNGILLEEGDELCDVILTDGRQNILVATNQGLGIRFRETDARPMGRVTRGVWAIDLAEEDFVVGVAAARDGCQLLTVTEKGYGKRTDIEEFKIQKRGGKGLIAHNVTEKTGLLAGIKVVDNDDDIILISSDGIVIRTAVNEISTYSRNTQGVSVMRLGEDGRVVTVARTAKEQDEDMADKLPATLAEQEEGASEENAESEVTSETNE